MTPAHIKLAVALLIMFASFGAGWKVNGWRYEADLKAQAEQALKDKEGYELLSRALVKRVQEEQAKTKIVYREINRGIDNATTNTLCLSADAGRLWDNALTGLPTATTGTIENTARADTFTDRETLKNAVANFEQYKDCRTQLLALIEFHKKDK
jgi:hypothetical protein